MSGSTEIAIVQAWHDALNGGDLDRFAALLHDDVEFGGPKGAGRGKALVRDWAERAGIQMHPTRWFQRDGDVVVAQRARWRDPETGALGEAIDLASHFVIDDGLVRRVARFDTLQQALEAAGLDQAAAIDRAGTSAS